MLVRVYELYTSGRHEQAREEFYRYLPFIRLGSVPGGMAMAVHKEVLVKGGIFRTAKVRNPYVPASPELLGWSGRRSKRARSRRLNTQKHK